MRFSTIISVMLHVAAVGIWFIMPASWRTISVEPAPIVPIDIISEAELSERLSVVETRAEPEPEPVEEQPAPEEIEQVDPTPTTQPEPEPQEARPEPEPVVLPPEPEEEEAAEEEPVEEEPVQEEPEPEPEPVEEEPEPEPEPVVTPPEPEPEPARDELDFSALESALTDLDQEETSAPREIVEDTGQAQQADRDQNQVGLGDRLTANEEALIRSRVAQCWTMTATAGAPEPEKLIVRISFELNRDGSFKREPRVENAMQINTSGNPFWKVAEREALNAVRGCAPYDFLPEDRYQIWSQVTFNFNPSQMAGVN